MNSEIVGDFQDAGTLSDGEVGIFGGLLNCVQNGAMERALESFQKSNSVIDNLMRIEINGGAS